MSSALQRSLEALDAAIASGARSVSFDGKTTTFDDLDGMFRRRAWLLRQIEGARGKSTTVLAAHDRGYGGGPSRFGRAE